MNMFPVATALTVFAQTQLPEKPTTAQTVTSFLPMALIAVGFYFLFIAPQRKKQKEHEKLLSSLQSGDEVLTTGGIYGTITNVKDDRFVVRIAEGTKIEVGKSFVSAVTKKSGPQENK